MNLDKNTNLRMVNFIHDIRYSIKSKSRPDRYAELICTTWQGYVCFLHTGYVVIGTTFLFWGWRIGTSKTTNKIKEPYCIFSILSHGDSGYIRMLDKESPLSQWAMTSSRFRRDTAQNIQFHIEDAINELIKIRVYYVVYYIDTAFHIYKSKQGA